MLSVIVPAYNEEKAIEETLKVLENFLKGRFPDFEVVVVSDGSRDRTFALAQKYQSESVKVFEYQPNRGKGNALRYGFGKSRGDLVVFYDTGVDFPPSQIGDFLETLQKAGADLVIGSKRHPRSKVHYPLVRRAVSFAVQILVKILFDLKVTDTQVGLKVFKRRVLEEIMPRVLVKRFAFDIEILALARHCGFGIVEAPVKLNLRFPSAFSLVGRNSIWNCLRDTLAVFYRLRILRFYDLPEAERDRLIREYRTTPWDRLASAISRILGVRDFNEKS